MSERKEQTDGQVLDRQTKFEKVNFVRFAPV